MIARAVLRAPLPRMAYDCVSLAHHERLLRRRRLLTVHDEAFLVDLPRTTAVEQGCAFELEDGRLVDVVAAEEPLIEVRLAATAGDAGLARLAWHLGNRHCPCQIEPDRLLIARDPVLREMLRGLGAELRDVSEPFHPEGGAYGSGAPLGHSQGGDDLHLGSLGDG